MRLPSILYRYINCYVLSLHGLGWIHYHALNYQVGKRIRRYYSGIGRTRIVKRTSSKISLELKCIRSILVIITIKIPITKIGYISITYNPCVKAPGLVSLVPSPTFNIVIPCMTRIDLCARPVYVLRRSYSRVCHINEGTKISGRKRTGVTQFCMY